MHYKTIVLELLQQHTEIHNQLRSKRMLLPARIARGLPLYPYDRATFYTGGARGYTDYPFSTLPRGGNP